MTQFNLLRYKRFLPIFGTQFFGVLNDNVFKNAIVILVTFSIATEINIDSHFLVILAAGIFIMPFFLFSAIAGQLADKFEKSMLIRRIKFLEIIIMLLGSVGFYFNHVPLLMLVLFFMGMQSTLFGPLKYGILPQHLTGGELLGGNGLIQMATYVGILIGTIVGGVLIDIEPAGSLYVSATIITLAVMGCVASFFIPEAPALDGSLRINWNVPREIGRIIGYAREQEIVFWTIIGISWFWFYGAIFLSLLPHYTQNELHADSNIATLMLAVFSIGIGAGSLLCNSLVRKQTYFKSVLVGAIGLTFFAAMLAFAPLPEHEALPDGVFTIGLFLQHAGHWWVLLSLGLIGMSGGLYIVPFYAVMQQESHPSRRCRIVAANNIINALFIVIASVFLLILSYMGMEIRHIFLTVALLNLAATVLVVKQARALRR